MLMVVGISGGAHAEAEAEADEEETIQGLEPGPNREAVTQNCLACHSGRLIAQQSKSRKNWDKTITWMQEEQGMWELDEETREKILDYLEETYGPGQESYIP